MASKQRDWYSVSVDSLRLTIGGVLLLLLGVGGFYGYRQWQVHAVERSAFEVVAKSQGLIKQLKTEEDLKLYRSDYAAAAARLEEAESALAVDSFPQALELGSESLSTLEGILDSIRYRGQRGIAWFISVEGDVEYQRGERGQFVAARARDELYEGDYVRSSSNGSAEIYISHEDAKLIVRPGALIKLSRSASSGGEGSSVGFMEYGWVALNTSQSTSGITTKYSEVTIEGNSQATVSLPRDSSQSQVAVTRGRAAVRSARTGEVRELGELQQVVQSGGRLGPTNRLPAPPQLMEPPDKFSINIDSTKEVKLVWHRVDGADSYALQISRSRLFSDSIIDDQGRQGTSATVGLVEEGSYLWRVAAFNRNGQRGPWSPPRKFRVASFRGLSLEADTIAPELEVEVIPQGDIVILRGHTEPGASLEMNGEEISVNADGSFSTSEQLYAGDEEWVALVFKARDEAGNTTTVRRRAFLTSL